ncbi:uncharacterized protein [Haliotis asinina]|uniref:uncharacterized protein n=1 Tax=Haliotis asinina TaxID=109174 RepID=UPI003531D3A8
MLSQLPPPPPTPHPPPSLTYTEPDNPVISSMSIDLRNLEPMSCVNQAPLFNGVPVLNGIHERKRRKFDPIYTVFKEPSHQTHLTESSPPAHLTESTPPAYPTETPPPAHLTESTPPAHLTESTPPAYPTETPPPAHLTESTPPAHLTEETPPAYLTESIPLAYLTDSTSLAYQTESTPPAYLTESVSPFPQTESRLLPSVIAVQDAGDVAVSSRIATDDDSVFSGGKGGKDVLQSRHAAISPTGSKFLPRELP